MKYRNSARALALVLAGMLACPAVSVQAATFADMNNVPWPGAEKSIQKAADLKLVVGETINGKSYFKPKDPVSLTQSCQLAYKLLLETGKAKADAEITKKWSIVMDTYKIQSWAHPSVAYCLENGIIQISELGSFINGEINVSATREQAAEILGRALEVGMPELKATASTTIFKDNASISADARPYIALLNSQKIVNGDDLGKFNPKSTLNRTETAVMVTNMHSILSKAASKPEETKPTSVTGKVATLTKFYVNFENSNAYYLIPTTTVPVTLNGATSSVEAVVALFKEGKAAMTAVVSLDGNSRVTALAITSDAAGDEKVKDTEGIITKITYDDDDEDGKLELNDKSTYYVDDVRDVTILITDEDDDEEDYRWDELLELYEECKDDDKAIEVKLTLYSDGDLKTITGEIVDAEDEDKDEDEASGKVESVTYDDEDEEGKIKVNGEEYDAPDTEKVEIEIKDGSKGEIDTWKELYEAYKDGKTLEVNLILDDDEVVEITGKVTVAKGYLTGFDDNCLKIKGKKSSTTVKYYFTDYDRDDEDEEEDWEEDVTDIEIEGLYNVDNLYDFFDIWLDDEDTKLGTGSNDDCFEMEIKLDKNGYIVDIEADQK